MGIRLGPVHHPEGLSTNDSVKAASLTVAPLWELEQKVLSNDGGGVGSLQVLGFSSQSTSDEVLPVTSSSNI